MDEIIPKADALTTAEDYVPAERAKAYDLFLNRAMSLDDVAITMSIDRNALLGWAKQGKWTARKKAILEELNKSVEQKFQNWALDNKIKVAERQLEIGSSIEESIKDLLNKLKLDKKVSSTELMRLAKSLAEVSNVSARAVGLDSEGAGPAQVAQQNAKQPLIIIGLKPIRQQDGGTSIEADYTEGEA
jgi:hypothetical protein